MVNFLKKRLQVFVSSTYLDLKQERQTAVSAILTSGHIPAGMELFTAGDKSQMMVIKQWIDESDVFLLILGSRYGSIEPETGKSYTHLEYDYALSQDKPLFACVINNRAINDRVKKLGRSCLEQDNPQKLKEFREFTLTKPSGFWSDTKDIQLEIMKALQNFARREDLTGWVKGDESVDTVALTEELTRLSQENASLRQEKQLLPAGSGSGEALNSNQLGISYEQMKSILENYVIKKEDIILQLPENLKKQFDQETFSLLELFKKISRHTMISKFLVSNSSLLHDYLLTLCEKNLVEIIQHSGNYGNYFKLDSEGRQFLNWLEYQELNP